MDHGRWAKCSKQLSEEAWNDGIGHGYQPWRWISKNPSCWFHEDWRGSSFILVQTRIHRSMKHAKQANIWVIGQIFLHLSQSPAGPEIVSDWSSPDMDDRDQVSKCDQFRQQGLLSKLRAVWIDLNMSRFRAKHVQQSWCCNFFFRSRLLRKRSQRGREGKLHQTKLGPIRKITPQVLFDVKLKQW